MAELNTIARPYSKAAFDYALDKGDVEQWSSLLKTAALTTQDNLMHPLINDPQLTKEDKANLILEICGKNNEGVANFIYLLAENRRLALLPKISEQFDLFKAIHEKIVDIDLTTAFEIDQSLLDKLTQALSSKLGREVRMTTNTDKALIGGVVLRGNDFVIDGSVRAKLAKLAEAMSS